uniref:Eukaryotic translation initiation factor 4 gamma 3 n=1 Tax=Aceria tosichella TaxID=561515 RepID=A0A6G1SEQ8_9ACAR
MIPPLDDDYMRVPPPPRRGRQFSRGGGSGGGGGGGGGGGVVPGGPAGPGGPGGQSSRRYKAHQFIRTRSPPSGKYDGPQQGQQPYNNSHSQQQQNYSNNNNNNRQQSSSRAQQQSQPQQHRNSQHDIEEIKEICSKLSVELELVKTRVNEIAGNLERMQSQMNHQSSGQTTQNLTTTIATDNNSTKQKKAKVLRKHQQERAAGPNGASVVGQNSVDSSNNNAFARNNKERNLDRQRRNRRREDDRDKENKALPPRLQNDDSTTQAADPSSEDKVEGEGDGGERVKKVYRRKKPFNKRGYNRRRRMDSSERNSNDTSPQNEANGDEYQRRPKPRSGPKRNFPELSEAELNEIVQAVKRDFFASELTSVRKVIEEKGPIVAKEFAMAILDHAICDVTSPTKLSDIANNLAQILVSDDVGFEFQQGFCSALNDISKREEDIAIDAPRYMDTLGQVLGQCLVPMNTGRNKQLIKKFLTKSLQSYAQQSRALLLASTMRGIAGRKDERFAKEIWDMANLDWATYLNEGTNLDEFLESQEVKFTTQSFSPEPRKTRRTPEETEKFADDVTDLVEKRCSSQALEDLVKDLNLEDDETVDYLGTLVYAIVRGCLVTDAGDYKLDTEALNKYSSILKNPQQQNKKDQADAIALNALTALTKLWHQYNCPQNLMSNILLALHNHGAASYDALKNWLNSEDLKNIPGIGAARLNSKRCIEDLGAKRS